LGVPLVYLFEMDGSMVGSSWVRSVLTATAKYVSVLLLSLMAMLQLELPRPSKVDLLTQYGDLGNVSDPR